jgi:hypothetical protein
MMYPYYRYEKNSKELQSFFFAAMGARGAIKIKDQLQELRSKQRKLTFVLGELLYGLYKVQHIRFLYTSYGVKREREVEKILKLLNHLTNRMKKFQELYSVESAPEEAKGGCLDRRVIATPVRKSNRQPQRPGDESTKTVKDRTAQEEAPELALPIEEIICKAKFESDRERELFEQSLKCLSSEDERARERSLRSISHISDKVSLKRAYRLAMSDKSNNVRLRVLKLILYSREKENEELYRIGLNDCDSRVRAAAIKGLSTIAHPDNFSLVASMLKDRDPYIRAITVINLTIYYGQQGVERATELLDDENPHVRKSLVDTLLVVKPKGCLSLIKKMLDDPDAEVKKAATAAYEKCVSGGLE